MSSGGLLAKKKHDSFWYNIVVLLVMEVLTYVVGLIWLKTKLDTTWARTFAIGATPFIVGDTLKIIVAAEASKILYPEVQKLAEKLKRREKDE